MRLPSSNNQAVSARAQTLSNQEHNPSNPARPFSNTGHTINPDIKIRVNITLKGPKALRATDILNMASRVAIPSTTKEVTMQVTSSQLTMLDTVSDSAEIAASLFAVARRAR